MYKLIAKNNSLFALNDSKFVGEVINNISGKCINNPDNNYFYEIFGGHGEIIHKSAFESSFENPEILPIGTEYVFLDHSQETENDFYAETVKIYE